MVEILAPGKFAAGKRGVVGGAVVRRARLGTRRGRADGVTGFDPVPGRGVMAEGNPFTSSHRAEGGFPFR